MKKFYAILAVMLAAVSFTSCDLCTVDGGEEGVFIKQPWFFGDGGVVEDPLTKGSEWKVWSTDYVKYSVVNNKYSVSFDDIATDEATPLDITAHLFLKIKEGKSPILHKNYGKDWYENNIKEVFSKHVRNFVSMHDMRSLISERDIYEEIEKTLKEDMTAYFAELSKDKEFPVDVVNVVIDKAKPNNNVLEELNNTAIYMQQKQTEIMKQDMQKERKKTEHLRALADKEYQLTMGFSPTQFIALRGLELENQKIEMIKNKTNVNVDVMLGQTTPMWDIKAK
jgi:regulator of protease activity HflC (stomatin/prohibitin superfamily)